MSRNISGILTSVSISVVKQKVIEGVISAYSLTASLLVDLKSITCDTTLYTSDTTLLTSDKS